MIKKFLMHVASGIWLSLLVFAITEDAREGLINEIFYADDLVLKSKNMENLTEKILKWKEAFVSKG